MSTPTRMILIAHNNRGEHHERLRIEVDEQRNMAQALLYTERKCFHSGLLDRVCKS